jgi:hypothetical protein
MTVRRTLLTVSEDDALVATGVAVEDLGAAGGCVSELATDGAAAMMVVLSSALVRP